MAIKLENNLTTIRITEGSVVRDIAKGRIIEISLIKNNIVKIDLGFGALRNVFFPYSQVTIPATGAPHVLINTLTDWLLYDGKANEERQVAIATSVNSLYNGIMLNHQELYKLNDKMLTEPLVIDQRANGTIYKGYAYAGTDFSEPYWAIQRMQVVGTQTITKWAEALLSPSLTWNDREAYQYY